jgi:hypothetical protein
MDFRERRPAADDQCDRNAKRPPKPFPACWQDAKDVRREAFAVGLFAVASAKRPMA